MTEPAKDPRFVYPDVPESAVPPGMLNDLMKWLIKDGISAGWMSWVSVGLKLSVISMYLWAIEKGHSMEVRRAKQKYEQDQANGNQDEADQDDPENA